jgi:hypothetical protein
MREWCQLARKIYQSIGKRCQNIYLHKGDKSQRPKWRQICLIRQSDSKVKVTQVGGPMEITQFAVEEYNIIINMVLFPAGTGKCFVLAGLTI